MVITQQSVTASSQRTSASSLRNAKTAQPALCLPAGEERSGKGRIIRSDDDIPLHHVDLNSTQLCPTPHLSSFSPTPASHIHRSIFHLAHTCTVHGSSHTPNGALRTLHPRSAAAGIRQQKGGSTTTYKGTRLKWTGGPGMLGAKPRYVRIACTEGSVCMHFTSTYITEGKG